MKISSRIWAPRWSRITSIQDLPDYNELLEKVQVVRNSDDRLYNHFEVKQTNEEVEQKLSQELKEVAMAQDEVVEDVMIGEFEQENLTDKEKGSKSFEEIEEQFDAFAEEVLENEILEENDDDLIEDEFDDEEDFDFDDDDDFV